VKYKSPSIDTDVNVAQIGSKAGNFLSGKREGERGGGGGRETEIESKIQVKLGPNLERPQGISYLEREVEREMEREIGLVRLG
jgi:hypothetical protein